MEEHGTHPAQPRLHVHGVGTGQAECRPVSGPGWPAVAADRDFPSESFWPGATGLSTLPTHCGGAMTSGPSPGSSGDPPNFLVNEMQCWPRFNCKDRQSSDLH